MKLKKYSNQLAFTLAEILIVVAIIGVTAVLTIPNLSTGIEEDKAVLKVKSTVDMLESAFSQTLMEHPNDADDFDGQNNQQKKLYSVNQNFCTHVKEHLKIGKDCGNGTGCFADREVLDIKGDSYLNSSVEKRGYHLCSFMLENGTSVSIDKYARVFIDIDGPDGANTAGKDVFDGLISSMGSIVPRNDGELSGTEEILYSPLTWIRQKGNFEYLKCLDSLNWKTQTTCP